MCVRERCGSGEVFLNKALNPGVIREEMASFDSMKVE